MNTKRLRYYSDYLKEIFATSVQKLPVDAGFSCPNRDGTISTGGCAFCNNSAFTASYCDSMLTVREQLDRGVAFHLSRGREAGRYLAYFQSFSNTHAPLSRLRALYEEALAYPGVAGIVIGTRPDCVDEVKLDYLAELSRDAYVLVEYGVESCCDEALLSCGRGHDYACSRRALEMTLERGIRAGAHLVFGLPEESREQMLDDVSRLSAYPLDTLKLHQLQILKGTRYEARYAEHPENFELFGMEEYLELVVDAVRRMRPDTVIERFVNEVPPGYLVAPRWGGVKGDLLWRKLEERMENNDFFQGDSYFGTHVE